MTINPGRTSLNIQMRTEHKQQLVELKNYYREKINPNMSMTMVIELIILEKHKKLKLDEKTDAM